MTILGRTAVNKQGISAPDAAMWATAFCGMDTTSRDE